jgi:ABC-type uncharacterized transport system involved in gliding motility auxiliary subunit
VTTYESQPIVRDLKEVATAFPLSRTLEVKSPGKGTAEKLFTTSANSYATTRLNSAEIRIDPKTDKKGPLTLAAAGTYNSSGDKSKEGRFVVVGSSNWVDNNILRFNGNRDLFLNMMNWLSSDEDLISIRPKEPEDRRLNLSGRQMSVLFYSSMVFLPPHRGGVRIRRLVAQDDRDEIPGPTRRGVLLAALGGAAWWSEKSRRLMPASLRLMRHQRFLRSQRTSSSKFSSSRRRAIRRR